MLHSFYIQLKKTLAHAVAFSYEKETAETLKKYTKKTSCSKTY